MFYSLRLLISFIICISFSINSISVFAKSSNLSLIELSSTENENANDQDRDELHFLDELILPYFISLKFHDLNKQIDLNFLFKERLFKNHKSYPPFRPPNYVI